MHSSPAGERKTQKIESNHEEQKPSRARPIACALLAIAIISSLALAGAGVAGYFHVGALSSLKQIDAIIMMAAGGGAAFTFLCLFVVVYRCGKSAAAPKNEDAGIIQQESISASPPLTRKLDKPIDEALSEAPKVSASEEDEPEVVEIAEDEPVVVTAVEDEPEVIKIGEDEPEIVEKAATSKVKEPIIEQAPILQKEPPGPLDIGTESEWKNDFLNTSLMGWLFKPDEYSRKGSWYLSEDVKDLRQKINERIELLDQECQLKEKLKKLPNYKKPSFALRDLLPAWTDSPIRLAVMTRVELEKVSVSSLYQMDQHVLWQATSDTVKFFTTKAQNLAGKSFEELLLSDLPSLSAEQINSYPLESFPPVALMFLNPEELKEVDTKNLTVDQAEWLFHLRITFLTTEQIYSGWRLVQNKAFLGCISNEQAAQFVPEEIDQEFFKVIFPCSNRGGHLSELDLDRIYGLSRYFTDEHWNYIGAKRTREFDFDRIDETQRQVAFNGLFSVTYPRYSENAKLLEELLPEKIYQLSPYFTDEHWKYLGVEQTVDFDIDRIAKSQRQVAINALFSVEPKSYSKASKLLNKLPLEKIYQLSPYFTDAHWEYLSEKQTVDFDFDQIAESQRQVAINALFSVKSNLYSKAAKALPLMSEERIERVKPYLPPGAEKYIPKK